MQISDKTPLSISPAGHCQLVKVLIPLEPWGILWSNSAYLYIWRLYGHWYACVEPILFRKSLLEDFKNKIKYPFLLNDDKHRRKMYISKHDAF